MSDLKKVPVSVKSIRRVGKSSRGYNIYELDTSRGKFRTAANSTAGFQLSPMREGSKPYAMVLHINSRGTVSGVDTKR